MPAEQGALFRAEGGPGFAAIGLEAEARQAESNNPCLSG
jgi:hypothetical protein